MRKLFRDALWLTLGSLALLIVVTSTQARACEVTERPGAPQAQIPGISICRSGYELLYRPEYKTALWSAEHIRAENVKGPMVRKDMFRADPEVPDAMEAQLSDYARSGYARGHLAPVGDFRTNPQEAQESFYLTNMVPQTQKCNNAGVWAQLEDVVRDWAVHYGELYVVSGPIYTDAPRFIGNKVRIPDAMYKVVWNPKLNQKVAFMVPNEELCGMKVRNFVTPIEEIEKLTQIRFFPLVESTEAGLWQ